MNTSTNTFNKIPKLKIKMYYKSKITQIIWKIIGQL